MNTYHRLPALFVSGDGAWLTDADGKRYLDFTSGIAVNSLGHNFPPLVAALREQAGRLMHVCNYYQSDVSAAFARKLVEMSGMRALFFSNSGAEANECAIKIARKYGLARSGPRCCRVVTLKGGFHGRTITALSASGQEKLHADFGPFTEGFVYIPPNDTGALDAALRDDSVCALLLEPVQGESGVIPLSEAFMRRAAETCARRDILLVADEVQTGAGRTGAFLACRNYGVEPDLATLAKGICGGIPAGVTLAGEKAAGVLKPGDHGSTFGGNVLAARAGLVVLETLGADGFMAGIAEKGAFFTRALRGAGIPGLSGIRGSGLLIGADLDRDVRPVLERALAEGLLVLSAGARTLRFLPPFVIGNDEIEEGVERLKKAVTG